MHGKSYQNANEESIRREIFNRNKAKIEAFNENEAPSAGFTLGVNHMTDWTEDEFNSINGLKGKHLTQNAPVNSQEAQVFLDKILNDDSPVPAKVDWRQVSGRVSPVKNQLRCGSCWAFATTGLLEGQEMNRNMSKLDTLSEQNLVDCSESNAGCEGGTMHDALDDIHKMGGIEDESAYPYTAKEGSCNYEKSKAVFKDKSYAILPCDEEALKKTVARYGPVAVGIYASENLQRYQSGVFNDKLCEIAEYPNHGVLIVGYGTDDNGKDYWIVKNSWGEDWGQKGYVHMSRNKNNQCFIASSATIATF